MSDDVDDYTEEDILNETICGLPDEFFNYEGYSHPRTRNTAAILDYIKYLQAGSAVPHTLSQYSGRHARREVLKDLKGRIPNSCFTSIGLDDNKHRVCPDRDRELILLAAKYYIDNFNSVDKQERDQADDPDLTVSQEQHMGGLNVAKSQTQQSRPRQNFTQRTSSQPSQPSLAASPIDRIIRDVRQVEASVERQGKENLQLKSENRKLRKRESELETLLEQRSADVEVLMLMISAAGISREMVEGAMHLVHGGNSVEEVVAEVLKKAFQQ